MHVPAGMDTRPHPLSELPQIWIPDRFACPVGAHPRRPVVSQQNVNTTMVTAGGAGELVQLRPVPIDTLLGVAAFRFRSVAVLR